MAIKVKHEGNVTSRIYAAATGGKGKRQAEDAKVLLAAQQRGNGGGGGTGGGARAGGNAPTMAAPTSHAALGSTGQMLSPPSMSFNQRTQLQAQQDEAAKDRLITDHKWRTEEKKLDREHATKLKQSEIDNYNAQSALDREQREALQQAELDWRANQSQKERDHKDSVLNRTMRREERLKLGFSTDQILDLEKIDADKVAVMGNNSLTKEEKDLALLDLDRKAQEMMPLYPPQATTQQDFENSIVTDPNTGLRYRKTSRGDYELLETPPSSQNDAAAKSQARQAQKAWDSYQKFISDEVKAAYGVAEKDGTPFDRAAEEAKAKKMYKAIYGVIPSDPNASPTPTPSPSPTQGGSVSSQDVLDMETVLKRRGLIK